MVHVDVITALVTAQWETMQGPNQETNMFSFQSVHINQGLAKTY